MASNQPKELRLHDCVRSGDAMLTRLCLNLGQGVNDKDESGIEALVCADFTNPKVVELLLIAGANVEAVDELGYTALHFATMNKCLDSMRLLLRHARVDVNAVNTDGMTPLHHAVLMDRYNMVYEHSDDHREINMLIATHTCEDYEIELCRWDRTTVFFDDRWTDRDRLCIPLDYLCGEIERVAGVALQRENRRNLHDENLLGEALFDAGCQLAALKSESTLHVAAGRDLKADCRVVKLLLEAGANPNAKNDRGTTAFAMSTWAGDLRMTRLMIEHGADVQARDDRGETALHFAAKNVDHPEVLAHLIDLGLDVNAANAKGWTPLHHAAEAGNSRGCEILLSRGALADGDNNEGIHPLGVLLEKWDIWNRYARLQTLLNCRSEVARQLFKIPLRGTMDVLLQRTAVLGRRNPGVLKINVDLDGQQSFLREHYDECVRELDELENAKLTEDVSLLDILEQTSEKRLGMYARNEDVVQAFLNIKGSLGSRFPLYRGAIVERFEYEMNRQRIMGVAATFLSRVLELNDPHHVVNRKIMAILGDDEVLRIGKALKGKCDYPTYY